MKTVRGRRRGRSSRRRHITTQRDGWEHSVEEKRQTDEKEITETIEDMLGGNVRGNRLHE